MHVLHRQRLALLWSLGRQNSLLPNSKANSWNAQNIQCLLIHDTSPLLCLTTASSSGKTKVGKEQSHPRFFLLHQHKVKSQWIPSHCHLFIHQTVHTTKRLDHRNFPDHVSCLFSQNYRVDRSHLGPKHRCWFWLIGKPPPLITVTGLSC